MRALVFFGSLLVLASIAPALATAALAADAAAPGRFTLTPAANGSFVRLDTQTGEVSECSGAAAALVCKSTPDERSALQAQIDKLTKENAELRATAATQPAADSGAEVKIPSDKDVDKAFNFMERMIKRFRGLIDEMRKEPTEPQPL